MTPRLPACVRTAGRSIGWRPLILMSVRAFLVATIGLLCAVASATYAQQNMDPIIIPQSILEGSETPQPAVDERNREIFVENSLTLQSHRGDLIVPFPSPLPYDWQNRTSVDLRYQRNLGDTFSLTVSNRMNLLAESDPDDASSAEFRNDFREGFVSWQPGDGVFFEVGRINVRNGVALGFSPTDFFAKRTSVEQASLEPSSARENRLGVGMVRGEVFWAGGVGSVAYAPKLASVEPLAAGAKPVFDPLFGMTNSAHRFLATVDFDIMDLNPQAQLYYEDGSTSIGASLSYLVSESTLLYGEWSGGKRLDLISDADAFGRETERIPAVAPAMLPTSSKERFRHAVAVGVSHAWVHPKLVVNLEYHFDETAFSRSDWNNWFSVGDAARNSLTTTQQLWSIRGFAVDQERLVSQHQLYARLSWTDAFVKRVQLTAFAIVNPYDFSTLTQVSAQYDLSDRWSIGAFANGNIGDNRSERGSLPLQVQAVLQVRRNF